MGKPASQNQVTALMSFERPERKLIRGRGQSPWPPAGLYLSVLSGATCLSRLPMTCFPAHCLHLLSKTSRPRLCLALLTLLLQMSRQSLPRSLKVSLCTQLHRLYLCARVDDPPHPQPHLKTPPTTPHTRPSLLQE